MKRKNYFEEEKNDDHQYVESFSYIIYIYLHIIIYLPYDKICFIKNNHTS